MRKYSISIEASTKNMNEKITKIWEIKIRIREERMMSSMKLNIFRDIRGRSLRLGEAPKGDATGERHSRFFTSISPIWQKLLFEGSNIGDNKVQYTPDGDDKGNNLNCIDVP
ncbi:hypothetical protein MTR_8g062500 [Medicago truncatula]|uniref:Uncharacterized protein n=1 Tax=Medicago truncatula TaxID=3880 RepID=G7LEN4_MEDTR|nr:hypothetical protein MTR_8g062500 [Medicago truncatula]